MHLKFKVTEEDLLAYQMYHASHSKAVLRTLNFQRFLMPVVFLIAPFVMRSRGFPLQVYLPFFTVSALGWLVFYPRYFWWTMKRRTSKMFNEEDIRGAAGTHQLTITPDGLTGKNKDVQSSVSWDMVQNVACTDNYIFILLGAGKAAIIPRKVFNSENNCKEFLELIDGYRRSSGIDKKPENS